MQVVGLSELEKNFGKIAAVLDAGGLVIFPTETCYGALVRADLDAAVTKLLAYKQRPVGKAISVGRGSAAEALEYLVTQSKLRTLAEKFLPGPVTLVGVSSGKVDKRLETEEGTLGVRVPAYDPLLKFLSFYKHPVTTTSANSSGEPTPYSPEGLFKHLSDKKKEMIDVLVDARSLPHNPPSLVIDTTQTDKVYRPGLLTARDLEEGEVFLSQSQEQTAQIAANAVKLATKHTTADNNATVPVVYLLEGEMGAGKTQFAKGIAQGLGIVSTVNSPSYNLVKEYSTPTGQTFYHADLWRLTEKLALLELGIGLTSRVIAAIEWPANLADTEELQKLADADEMKLYSVKVLKIGELQRRIVMTKL